MTVPDACEMGDFAQGLGQTGSSTDSRQQRGEMKGFLELIEEAWGEI